MGDQSQRIAIVGMAGRFPGAADLTRYWQNLRNGVESITFFSRDELRRMHVDTAWLDNPSFVAASPRLDGRELFDAGFFGYSAQEAEIIDPQQRLFLESAQDALENAGYAGDAQDGLIGVYAGSSQNMYLWFNLLARPGFFERHGGFRTVITNGADYLATRAAYKLNLTGPAVTVQTACSTSLVAVHMACQGLLNFECDLALAGGVSLRVTPIVGYIYEAGGLISRDGHCRVFDAAASGTLFGDGVGVIALKRLDDALKDGDTVHAVILGSAINNDGAHKAGFTAPATAGQAAVIFQALEASGVSADSISYVEAHGTGTVLGDPIEVKSLTTAFRQTTTRQGFCGLGSVKSNIGHLDAAAGIAGLIKTVLALEHRELPPTLHYETPNPGIDFAASPFYVNRTLSPWSADTARRRAGVSAFGIGGTNAHVVLEEAPSVSSSSAAPAGPQLLVLSARSQAALARASANLAEALRAQPHINLADVAFTLGRGRRGFQHRRAIVARTTAEAAALLEQAGAAAAPGDDARASELARVGAAWEQGQEVDWKARWEGEPRRRIPLPTYPFERQRCWSDPLADMADTGNRTLARAAGPPVETDRARDIADWFSVPVWKQSAAVPRRDGAAGARWLVIGDASGMATDIVCELRDRGADVTADEGRSDEAGDYTALFMRLRAAGRMPQRIVCTTPAAGGERAAFYVPLAIVQALAAGTEPVRVGFVTTHTYDVTGDDRPAPDGALAAGVARVASREIPGLTARVIDVLYDGSLLYPDRNLAIQILREFDLEDAAALVAYRGGRRWLQAFEPVQIDRAADALAPRDAAYIITGGFGGLGLTFARALASRGARLALIGRTDGHPDALRELEAAGARVLALRADVSDAPALAKAFAAARAAFGPIAGVIHAAGVPGGGLLTLKTREMAAAVLAPKVAGTRALLAACAKIEPGFVALCSSIAAITGDVGQVDYCAANAYLDAVADAARLSRTRVVSINWDAWRGVGMAVETRVSSSIREQREHSLARGIDPGRGADALLRALSQPHPQVIVSPAGLDLRLAEAEAGAVGVRLPVAPTRRHPRPVLTAPYVAPRSEPERRLAAMWEDLLAIDGLGVHDNFFELGGDSLLATQLLARLPAAFGRTWSLRELMECSTIAAMTAKVIGGPAVDDIDGVSEDRAAGPAAQAGIPVRAVYTPAPLSFAQERLWLLDRLDPGNAAYAVTFAVRIHGPLDAAVVQRVLDWLVARHEALRTTFGDLEGQPVQHIGPSGSAALTRIDLTSVDETRRPAEILRLARDEFERPFSLDVGPLFRTTLLEVAPDDHVLLFCMHHIVSDAWSLEQVVREFAEEYLGDAADRSRLAERPPLQYADFAVWQRAWFTGEVRDRQVAYWTRQLAGLQPIDLPTLSRPPLQTFRGQVRRVIVPPEILQRLRHFARASDATLFMTLLAALAILLRRYSRQTDLAIGTPVTNRTRLETQRVIGLFANTVVMRIDTSGHPTPAALLARVRNVMLDAHEHQDLPFEQLVELLHPARDLSRNPLFDVFFIHRRRAKDADLPGLGAIDVDTTRTKFDLTLIVDEGPESLQCAFEYNTDLFTASAVERMGRHFEAIVDAMARLTCAIEDLPLLAAGERSGLLLAGAGISATCEADATIAERFSRTAARTPEVEALVCGGQRLTYEALDGRSRRLAAWLRARGAVPEERVGICLERSADLVTSALAVSCCGAAYIPLDPAFPAERLRLMVEDASPRLLITTSVVRQHLEQAGVTLETDRFVVMDEPATRAAIEATGPIAAPVECFREHLAYVIYTSGSTGRPKGVQVGTGAVMNFLASMHRQLPITAADRLAAVTTFSFDIAGLELWGPLTTGATVVLMTSDETRDGRMLAARLAEERVTVMQATPATWRVLLDGGWRNETGVRVVAGGEALPVELATALLTISPCLTNLYGPTETTIWSTLHRVGSVAGAIPIGRSIANTRVYVLDDRLEPVPAGVSGDLYIGGDGVARGYLGAPALTASSFLPDPHGPSGARMYRTGDLARWREDELLEFVGRADDQVKVRGFRIELGDVENALAAHPSIERVAAGVRPGPDGVSLLVAWYVSIGGATVDESQLRAWMRERLPDYMIPSAFVPVEAFPLTPNAKVDRRRLPAPDRAHRTRELVAPRTDLEQRVARIWADTLRLTTVSVEDDFFDAGGHSMLAARLLARVRDEFGVDVPLRAFFEGPSLSGLARAVSVLLEGGSLDTLSPALRAELMADSVLDPSIAPGAGTEVSGRQDAAVLLTGATGFLGAHLLAELLTSTPAHVHCLVRCESEAAGAGRLRDILQRYQVWQDDFAARMTIVPGDLDRARLGLEYSRFDALAESVGAIYHNGALVNFVMPYRRLRAPNVGGTTEVLRLAAAGSPKTVHYVSTMDVLGEAYLRATEETRVDDPSGLVHGYAQSKWVSERLIASARERGIPAAIYRPARIIGHSVTGIWNTDDFACRAIKGSIELGIVPDVDPIDNMSPVDYVSRAIVHLSRQAGVTTQRAFHVVNPRYYFWQRLFERVRAWGYALDVVPYREWRRRLAASTDNALKPLLPLFPVPPDEGPDGSDRRWTETPLVHCDRTSAALEGSGITCPPLDDTLWARYFDFFLRTGYVTPPTGVAGAL